MVGNYKGLLRMDKSMFILVLMHQTLGLKTIFGQHRDKLDNLLLLMLNKLTLISILEHIIMYQLLLLQIQMLWEHLP